MIHLVDNRQVHRHLSKYTWRAADEVLREEENKRGAHERSVCTRMSHPWWTSVLCIQQSCNCHRFSWFVVLFSARFLRQHRFSSNTNLHGHFAGWNFLPYFAPLIPESWSNYQKFPHFTFLIRAFVFVRDSQRVPKHRLLARRRDFQVLRRFIDFLWRHIATRVLCSSHTLFLSIFTVFRLFHRDSRALDVDGLRVGQHTVLGQWHQPVEAHFTRQNESFPRNAKIHFIHTALRTTN